MRLSILLVLAMAMSALAVSRGGKLYIRSKDTALLKEPRLGAPTVVKLQEGTEVIWEGVSEKDNQWHQVQVAGKKGFVLRSQLAPNPRQVELDSSSGKPMSAPAFANSGAACKDCQRSTTYGGSAMEQEAAAELIYVEQLNLAKATPAAIQAKSKELHGP